jgi:hypothetical protein
MVPLDIRDAYAGRSKLIKSLETQDWRQASLKGAQVRAQLLEEFEEKRCALNPQPIAQITPALGQTLAERIRARLLQEDEATRNDPKRAETWLSFVEAFNERTLSTIRLGPARAAPTCLGLAKACSPANRSGKGW